MRRAALLILAVALAACTAQPAIPADAPVGQPQTGLSHVPLTITSATGVHRFDVEVAKTLDQQEQGLMFVRHLAPNQGMIFPYDPPQPVSFWMHNTLIPLDIIYIRPGGTIIRIADAKPLDDTPLPSGEPVSVVLEIAGGRAAELGIAPGDKVSWGS